MEDSAEPKGSGGGVRPLCVGKIWRQIFAKCLLFVAGGEAKEARGTDQLCVGLEAGIKGGVHAMQRHQGLHQHDDDWGFLQKMRSSNEQSWTGTLRVIQRKWLASKGPS